MTFKKSYVPGILGSVLTLTVIMAAPVKAETKEETILNKTDWSTMAAANVEGYVNIRSEANADSEIVGVLMPGYAVTVTEKGDEWSKISSNGVEGYIKNEYLVFGEEAKAHYRNMCGITGVVQADSLRVREAASTDSAQIGTLTQNGEVSVFGEEADWYQIQYSGSSAYVHGDYVTLSEELKGAVSMEEYQASQACAASSAAAASTAGSSAFFAARFARSFTSAMVHSWSSAPDTSCQICSTVPTAAPMPTVSTHLPPAQEERRRTVPSGVG